MEEFLKDILKAIGYLLWMLFAGIGSSILVFIIYCLLS